MKIFCTYFDSGYLVKGMVMIESLRVCGEPAPILVVAFDDQSFRHLEGRKKDLLLIVVHKNQMFEKFPELEAVIKSRSQAELFFTSSPFLLKLGMERTLPGDLVLYLDADLFFFQNPEPVIRELSDGSIGIIEHKYPIGQRDLASKYGTFNVGVVIFRNDNEGRKVLDWWAQSCIDWCHDFPSEGRYADQGYLDEFPRLSSKTVVLKNSGFNLAPWNTRSSELAEINGSVLVDGEPLIFFHFHGLSRRWNHFVSGQLNYKSPLAPQVFRAIYQPYADALVAMEARLRQVGIVSPEPSRRGRGLRGFVFGVYKGLLNVLGIVTRQAVPVPKESYPK